MTTPAQRFDRDVGSYTREDQTNDYTHDLGVIVLPVAGRTAAHRVIRLHGGIAFRTVRWTMNKNGSPPIIPAAQDTDGDTLLHTVVSPAKPRPTAGGDGYDWLVSGKYTYVQDNPRVAGENAFPTGNAPFIVSPQADFAQLYVSSYISQDADITTDELASYAVANVPVREGGAVHWPFTILPAEASSTHLIEG